MDNISTSQSPTDVSSAAAASGVLLGVMVGLPGSGKSTLCTDLLALDSQNAFGPTRASDHKKKLQVWCLDIDKLYERLCLQKQEETQLTHSKRVNELNPRQHEFTKSQFCNDVPEPKQQGYKTEVNRWDATRAALWKEARVQALGSVKVLLGLLVDVQRTNGLVVKKKNKKNKKHCNNNGKNHDNNSDRNNDNEKNNNNNNNNNNNSSSSSSSSSNIQSSILRNKCENSEINPPESSAQRALASLHEWMNSQSIEWCWSDKIAESMSDTSRRRQSTHKFEHTYKYELQRTHNYERTHIYERQNTPNYDCQSSHNYACQSTQTFESSEQEEDVNESWLVGDEDHLVLLDDNMYYRSMRRAAAEVASSEGIGFLQLWLSADVLEASRGNDLRKVKTTTTTSAIDNVAGRGEGGNRGGRWVPSLVINRMADRFEAPMVDSADHGWENDPGPGGAGVIKLGPPPIVNVICGGGTATCVRTRRCDTDGEASMLTHAKSLCCNDSPCRALTSLDVAIHSKQQQQSQEEEEEEEVEQQKQKQHSSEETSATHRENVNGSDSTTSADLGGEKHNETGYITRATLDEEIPDSVDHIIHVTSAPTPAVAYSRFVAGSLFLDSSFVGSPVVAITRQTETVHSIVDCVCDILHNQPRPAKGWLHQRSLSYISATTNSPNMQDKKKKEGNVVHRLDLKLRAAVGLAVKQVESARRRLLVGNADSYKRRCMDELRGAVVERDSNNEGAVEQEIEQLSTTLVKRFEAILCDLVHDINMRNLADG